MCVAKFISSKQDVNVLVNMINTFATWKSNHVNVFNTCFVHVGSNSETGNKLLLKTGYVCRKQNQNRKYQIMDTVYDRKEHQL